MQITLGLMVPFLGTTLGSAMVFFMRKEMNKKIEKMLPIAKKYGAMFVLLPLSDEGIPETVEK